MKLTRIKWESFCLGWAAFGLYFFLATFFWASGVAPLRSVFYLFVLLPFLLILPIRKWRLSECGGIYTLSALLFAGYSALSTQWGNPSDLDVYIKQFIFIAFWLAGVAWVFHSRQIDMQWLYRVLITVGVVSGLATVLFFYVYEGHSITARMDGIGLAENPTIVAQIFGVTTLLAYILSLQSRNWQAAQLFFTIAMLCALPVLLSQTRGATLSLIITSLLALFIIRPKVAIWAPQIVFVVLGMVMLLCTIDVEDLLRTRGAVLSYRDIIWVELLNRSIENPFFGLGLEHNARINIPDVGLFHHAHNTWIDILYYTGLLGVVFALWHLLLLLRSFNRSPDVLPVYLWLVFGCLCQFTNGSTLMTAPDAKWWVYWIPAGLLAALISSRRYGD